MAFTVADNNSMAENANYSKKIFQNINCIKAGMLLH
jgi:hypothetical protein